MKKAEGGGTGKAERAGRQGQEESATVGEADAARGA